MGSAKDIILRPIGAREANGLVRRYHYSGKVVQNSQVHIGVFYEGRIEGAMQFGPSLDKRKIQGLVRGTKWNEFIELNRMAFSDRLPRNSESRAIAVSMRILREHAPHLRWVISFADATQCGDGAIYRASGFVLTGVKRNTQVWAAPSGERFSRTSLTDGSSKRQQGAARRLVSRASMTMKGRNGGGKIRAALEAEGVHVETGGASMASYIEAGWRPIPGHQLRYIYFLDREARTRLTVDEIPFERIHETGARMYRGRRLQRAGSIGGDASGCQPEEGGSSPTSALGSGSAP